MKEYVISGHSGLTYETFIIPKNISLIFYADLEETCYVPNDKESLDIVINSMNYLTIHATGERINNYEISFIKDNKFEGISEIKKDKNGVQNYNFFYPKTDNEGFIKLSELCESLTNNYLGEKIKLYCIFCRGSKREFKDEYGDFQNFDANQLFLNEAFDFDEIPKTEKQIDSKNNELDSFDFDPSLFGGKKKTTRKLKKRKSITLKKRKSITLKKKINHIKKKRKHKGKKRPNI